MKVVVSAGGRFHAINLAHQLNKKNSLNRLFSFSYTGADTNKIPEDLVGTINSCKFLDTAFQKLRLAHVINPSIFNSFKDNLFDSLVSREIKKLDKIDIFTGWAHYSLKSMEEAKKLGAKIIIESGSCHIKEQQKILIQEYERWGVNYSPINNSVIDKMIQEYNQTDYIMTLSEFSRQSFIRQGVATEKLLQVPCGIDVNFFCEAEKTKLLDKKFRVIYVGLINLRKGIPYLLQAWNQLNLPENQAELVLVGNTQKDFKQVLPKLKIKNKNIIFFGSCDRDQLKKLYLNSNVFVLPSIEDGFGMVAGEAMACGLPVICSKNTGVSEIIQDGAHGFLVQSQNWQSLAEKILWFYQNQEAAKQMGAAGKQHILNFSWDNYGDKIFELYKQILQGRM